MSRLSVTEFVCRKCNLQKNIEAMGYVIAGPACPQCHKPMIHIKPVQTELNLFPKSGRRT